MTFGVPFSPGLLANAPTATLSIDDREYTCQTEVLGRWQDHSVRWVLVHSVIEPTLADRAELRVRSESGPKTTHVGSNSKWANEQLKIHPILPAWRLQLIIDGKSFGTRTTSETTNTGALVQALSVRGDFGTECRLLQGIRWGLNLKEWIGLGLYEISTSLHNSRAARHKGGRWDLGEKTSLHFERFSLCSSRDNISSPVEIYNAGTIETSRTISITQESSGGENWQSAVHANQHGKVPCQIRGYTVQDGAGDLLGNGLRASPSLCVNLNDVETEICLTEFWENFPSCIRSDREVSIDFFPTWNESHELQPGEKKTQSAVIRQGSCIPKWATQLAFLPPILVPSNDWIVSSKAVYMAAGEIREPQLGSWSDDSLEGDNGLITNRELIDEYGWRNHGEVYADHENLHFPNSEPVVSHYNNQYDLIYGGLLSWFRTGRPEWWTFSDQLARHVSDIDIYHTTKDRAAYNGGMFWHTDHYQTAATATHRTYSSHNCANDAAYGGGPSNEHNYTSGLLLYYYLTGNDEARHAVRTLADWVVAMDDGRRSRFGGLCDSPTGLASQCYTPDFHGPSRGSGNSVNALLDGWLLTEDRRYLDFAETLIRRVVHPADDVDELGLLDVEARWSYTVFLVTLGRYLNCKRLHREEDDMYAYATASLLRYAEWMLKNELPYLDQREKLEYPTETWAAQDLRKANVLRLASTFHTGLSNKYADAADEISRAAIAAWCTFPQPLTARSIAILLTEAMRESFLWGQPNYQVAPAASGWPAKEFFSPQRTRVKALMRSLTGWVRLARTAVRPSTWQLLISGGKK